MKKIYRKRLGGAFRKRDAQQLGEFIESIDDKTPRNILNIARQHKDCVISKYIEWDNRIASEKFRLQQISGIISHIEVVIKEVGERTPVRAFYSITRDDIGRKMAYVNVEVAFSNNFYRKQIINRAKTEINNWMERYETDKELARIITAIRREI